MKITFFDQLAQIDELEMELQRIGEGERREGLASLKSEYRRTMHAAGLAQAIAGCYTRVEHVLEFVTREVDGEPLSGEKWHSDLLDRVSRPRRDVPRPAVIDRRTHAMLDELRQFRHLVKSIYPSLIRPSDVSKNLALLRKALPRFSRQFMAFVQKMKS